MRVWTSPTAAGGNIISSPSDSSAPFEVFDGGTCRDEFFFEPELLRAAVRFGVLGEDFSRFAFGFCALGRLALAGLLAPRRDCFLE